MIKNVLTAIAVALAVSNVSAQGVYYPLQSGDAWQYAGNGPWYHPTVTKDTVLPNGKHYAMIAGGPFQFQRQSGDQVYSFNGYGDQLLFDFSKLPGDTVISIPFSIPGHSDTTDIVLFARDSIYLFDRHLRRWQFGINWGRRMIDDEEGYDIVDSIGISEIALANGTLVLQSALIDGKLYQTTGIPNLLDSRPGNFSLGQNFPNPFNPRTRISFTLPAGGVPVLKVFNTIGQVVISEDLGYKEAGAHQIDLDAGRLSSGMYFYCLEFGPFTKTMKCVHIK
jgi:hypothetical protein